MHTTNIPFELNLINIESSCTTPSGYPIEVALALGNGQSYRSLVKPVGSWTDWDEELEASHGITKWELDRFGKYPDQIANELNLLCHEHTLYSDNWEADQLLINKLFSAARVPCAIHLLSIETIIDESYVEDWSNWKSFIAQVLGVDLEFCRGRDKARLAQTAIGLLYTEHGNELEPGYSNKKYIHHAA